MNTTNNPLAAGVGVDNSIREIESFATALERLKNKLQKAQDLIDNPTFKGKPIEWITENQYSIKATQNAITNTIEKDDVFKGKRHLISYEGITHTREQFLKAMFTDYKKHQYKVQFNNDNVFYLNSNQRAKLQYHILAQHFDLVNLDEQDKTDLYYLCLKHEGETAQRWLNRMEWENGHEKMITFGVALDVRSAKDKDGNDTTKTKGAWCYHVEMDDKKAVYKGVSMTWEQWASTLIIYIELAQDKIKAYFGDKASQYDNLGINRCMDKLYYQNGVYLTLPKEENSVLRAWLIQYYKGENAAFPYTGNMPLSDLEFTIDFQKDVDIVKVYDLKEPAQMAQYNTEHNARRNKERNTPLVLEKFALLDGVDEWRRKDIIALGLFDKDINNFMEHGLIIKTGWGKYARVFPHS